MGLFDFGKKKKFEVPKFPEVPKFESSVPRYEPTLSKIKEELESKSAEDIYKPAEPKIKDISIPQRKPIAEKHIVNVRPHIESGKPVFIKIDKYKEALETLEEIKRKVMDAEKAFEEIERMRQERDRQIDSWKANLQKIKERLINVDKKLFEL